MVFAKAIETKLVEKAWQSYSRAVYPKGAGHIQLQETKRAFFGGGLSAINGFMSVLDPGTEPTERDMAQMRAVYAELEQFALDVARGKA